MGTVKWQRLSVESFSRRHVKGWEQLPSLHSVFQDGGWLLDDDDVKADPRLSDVALRLLWDIKQRGGSPSSDFLRSMLDAVDDERSLSPGQSRGILNIVGGSIRGNRRRFWKSRDSRRDRDYGDENCLVCGGPLGTYLATARGIGDTCYGRVLERVS